HALAAAQFIPFPTLQFKLAGNTLPFSRRCWLSLSGVPAQRIFDHDYAGSAGAIHASAGGGGSAQQKLARSKAMFLSRSGRRILPSLLVVVGRAGSLRHFSRI